MLKNYSDAERKAFYKGIAVGGFCNFVFTLVVTILYYILNR